MVTFKRSKSKNADRGKGAEDAVHKFLQSWCDVANESNRLVDTKAAGRIIKAAPADFDYYSQQRLGTFFGLIEVKETEHEYRLARDKVPQLPAMRKRAHCGGLCFVVVHHSTLKIWRALDVEWMENHGDKGSWDLRGMPSFATPAEALAHTAPEVFG